MIKYTPLHRRLSEQIFFK